MDHFLPTATNHDHAVAIEPDGDRFRLTVSIADVAHFVRPGSPLDREAMERGNSVYFPGRCVPMLPEQLSGDVASLKADVDRRALSVSLRIDADGDVVSESFTVSWIRSRRVFTYEQVQAILDSHAAVEAPIADALKLMARCALALNRRRVARGPLDLEIPESENHVDAEGHPKSVRRRPDCYTTSAHRRAARRAGCAPAARCRSSAVTVRRSSARP